MFKVLIYNFQYLLKLFEKQSTVKLFLGRFEIILYKVNFFVRYALKILDEITEIYCIFFFLIFKS